MDYSTSKFAGGRKFTYKTKNGKIEGLTLENHNDTNSILHNSLWLYRDKKLISSAEFTRAGIKWTDYVLDKKVTGTIPFNQIEFID